MLRMLRLASALRQVLPEPRELGPVRFRHQPARRCHDALHGCALRAGNPPYIVTCQSMHTSGHQSQTCRNGFSAHVLVLAVVTWSNAQVLLLMDKTPAVISAARALQIDGSVYSVRRFIQLHFRFEHKLLGLCVAVLIAYCLFFRLAAALALKRVRLPCPLVSLLVSQHPA